MNTFYEYDAAGRQIATVQTFDANLNGVIDATDGGDQDNIPDSGTEFFRITSHYDAGGRQDVTTDSLLRQTEIIYDGLGRLNRQLGTSEQVV